MDKKRCQRIEDREEKKQSSPFASSTIVLVIEDAYHGPAGQRRVTASDEETKNSQPIHPGPHETVAAIE